MKKIVLYIHSRESFINIWVKNLSPSLKQMGFSIYIFHCIPTEKLPEKIKKNKNYINIRNCTIEEILGILNDIDPDFIVILGYRSVMEILMVRLAKSISIKTIYVQHGLVLGDYIPFFSRIKSIKLVNSFINFSSQMNLYFHFIKHRSIKSVYELYILLSAIFLSEYQYVGIDHYFLFSDKDVKTHKLIFKFNENQVKVIGYPIFTNISNRVAASKERNREKYIVYIHEDFIGQNLTTIGYHEEREYIIQLSDSAFANGYKFIVQLHPLESLKKYRDLFQSSNIDILQESILDELIRNASVVIGHSSAALFLPVFFRKPLLITNYPACKTKINTFEDISIPFKSASDLSEILSNPSLLCSRLSMYDEFIKNNMGYMNSYEDYAIAIDDILKENTSERCVQKI